MKDLIRTLLLVVAIYSTAIAVNSYGYFNTIGAMLCGISCAVFVLTEDKKKNYKL